MNVRVPGPVPSVAYDHFFMEGGDLMNGVAYAVPGVACSHFVTEADDLKKGAAPQVMETVSNAQYALEAIAGDCTVAPKQWSLQAPPVPSFAYASDWLAGAQEEGGSFKDCERGSLDTEHSIVIRFSVEHAPPARPTSMCFVHSPTTFLMELPEGRLPFEIGNILLDFIEALGRIQKIKMRVLKVRPFKFWVSAAAIIDGIEVRSKARAYRQDGGQYLLDLQRRQGCPIVFCQLYEEAKSFFANQGFVVRDHVVETLGCWLGLTDESSSCNFQKLPECLPPLPSPTSFVAV